MFKDFIFLGHQLAWGQLLSSGQASVGCVFHFKSICKVSVMLFGSISQIFQWLVWDLEGDLSCNSEFKIYSLLLRVNCRHVWLGCGPRSL